ncbi:hypothetical protein DN546_34810, partial [Burkholderia multivorans]
VDGARPHFNNLTGVFKLYHDYDALVSVSPDLREINAESLSRYAEPERFISARNVIDVDRVRNGAGRSTATNPHALSIDVRTLSDAVAEIGKHYSFDELISEASRQALVGGLLGAQKGKTFV